jgi:hypothetical protein
MNQYEAPRRTLEPVIDFGSVSDFEKSLLQKGKEGMQGNTRLCIWSSFGCGGKDI